MLSYTRDIIRRNCTESFWVRTAFAFLWEPSLVDSHCAGLRNQCLEVPLWIRPLLFKSACFSRVRSVPFANALKSPTSDECQKLHHYSCAPRQGHDLFSFSRCRGATSLASSPSSVSVFPSPFLSRPRSCCPTVGAYSGLIICNVCTRSGCQRLFIAFSHSCTYRGNQRKL